MKKEKRKRNQRANQGSKEPEIDVGQAVMVKNHNRTSKLDSHYKPYFRVIEQITPVTFRVKNVANGAEQTVHARNLKSVDIETWDIPQERLSGIRGKRKSTYVVPPSSDSDSEVSTHLSEVGGHESKPDLSNTDEETVPLAKLAKRRTYERSDSSDSDDDIPLAELKRKYERKARRLMQTRNTGDTSTGSNKEHSDMEINVIQRTKSRASGRDRSVTKNNIALDLIEIIKNRLA
jgi:hypothetical protein